MASAHTHLQVDSALPSQTSTTIEAPTSDLDRELQEDERELEMYGGDAPSRPHLSEGTNPTSNPKAVDPNRVGWDGPNDPENPQNWSYSYKWFITILSSLLTANVYVVLSSAPL